MEGTQETLRLRAYANLSRDFIDSATPLVSDVMTREYEGISWKAEAYNMLFALQATGFFSQDSTLKLLMFITPFAFPKALVAYRQDKITVKFADRIAKRLVLADAFSTDHIRRKLPQDMQTQAALTYAQDKKLKGLGKLIGRTLG